MDTITTIERKTIAEVVRPGMVRNFVLARASTVPTNMSTDAKLDSSSTEVVPVAKTTDKEDIDLPDLLTLAKLLWMATRSKYHHVVLFALLINELALFNWAMM